MNKPGLLATMLAAVMLPRTSPSFRSRRHLPTLSHEVQRKVNPPGSKIAKLAAKGRLGCW